jgi:hypothetical protein
VFPEGGRFELLELLELEATEAFAAVVADADDEGVDLLPKTDGPLAPANGDAGAAYARNPPFVWR